mmetsp:Transcript_116880/g.249737  ORF Transcript_116880/g.249737 Transcript_116880/m.249737 type:complete len:259 (+) Transcript_116880:320-1096(+)
MRRRLTSTTWKTCRPSPTSSLSGADAPQLSYPPSAPTPCWRKGPNSVVSPKASSGKTPVMTIGCARPRAKRMAYVRCRAHTARLNVGSAAKGESPLALARATPATAAATAAPLWDEPDTRLAEPRKRQSSTAAPLAPPSPAATAWAAKPRSAAAKPREARPKYIASLTSVHSSTEWSVWEQHPAETPATPSTAAAKKFDFLCSFAAIQTSGGGIVFGPALGEPTGEDFGFSFGLGFGLDLALVTGDQREAPRPLPRLG